MPGGYGQRIEFARSLKDARRHDAAFREFRSLSRDGFRDAEVLTEVAFMGLGIGLLGERDLVHRLIEIRAIDASYVWTDIILAIYANRLGMLDTAEDAIARARLADPEIDCIDTIAGRIRRNRHGLGLDG